MASVSPPTPKLDHKALESQLTHILAGSPRILILGVGENRMGDDGVGPWLSYHLYRTCHHPRVKIMNGGINPDERRQEMVEFQPEVILLIDAIASGLAPGSVQFYPESQILNYMPISSHTLPLPVFLDRLKMDLPRARMHLLGITPVHMLFEPEYHLYEEEGFTMEDFEQDPNIPFYKFYLSPVIGGIAKELLHLFQKTIAEQYR